MRKIDFYAGVNKEDESKLLELAKSLNATVGIPYDDLHGYYTFKLKGSWDDYRIFQKQTFVKSLTHYEE